MNDDEHSVLVVDDEKNIRLTVSEVLRGMDLPILTATNGEEALGVLAGSAVWLVLLDLRLPDLHGLEVVRRARELGSQAKFVIVTAHGTINSAVEGMKLGAVDYLQKPFTPDQLRGVVRAILTRKDLHHDEKSSYDDLVEVAIRTISNQRFGEARALIAAALSLDDRRPEANNLEGVLYEIAGHRFHAQQCYRKALSTDPTYEPARVYLRNSVEPGAEGSFILQEVKKDTLDRNR